MVKSHTSASKMSFKKGFTRKSHIARTRTGAIRVNKAKLSKSLPKVKPMSRYATRARVKSYVSPKSGKMPSVRQMIDAHMHAEPLWSQNSAMSKSKRGRSRSAPSRRMTRSSMRRTRSPSMHSPLRTRSRSSGKRRRRRGSKKSRSSSKRRRRRSSKSRSKSRSPGKKRRRRRGSKSRSRSR